MRKLTCAGLLVLLTISACHFHKKQASITPGPAQPATAAATPDTQPPAVISSQEQPTSAAASQAAAEPVLPQETQPVTRAAQTPANAASAPTDTIPAPDQAVFDGEKLIDTTQRLLPPYAALTPDAAAVQHAPWAYEQLKYGIYYGFIKAGTAYIRNRGLVNIDGHLAYLIQTSAFSAPVIDTVFKVRDINYSWIDAEQFYSYGYGQSVREGNYKRDEWIEFDYPAKKYIGQIQKKKEARTITGPLDIHVQDMLSALYYVRAQELSVGKDIVFDIINREKQYPLVVKVLKKEKVKTSAGKFDCILVEPQLRGEGIFVAKGKSLKVWLTDDAYKMPVKMSAEVFIGSVSAELLAYQRQAPANIL